MRDIFFQFNLTSSFHILDQGIYCIGHCEKCQGLKTSTVLNTKWGDNIKTCLKPGALLLGALFQLLHGLLQALGSLEDSEGVLGTAGQPQVWPALLDLREGSPHGADVLHNHLQRCMGWDGEV